MALFKTHTHTSSHRGGKSSGVAGVIFGLIFAAFSSIFIYLGVKTSVDDASRNQWPTAPCSIQKFNIKSRPNLDPPFQPKVKFTYEWENKQYTGSKVWPKKLGEEEFEELGELIEQVRNKQITQCYINPEKPNEAILVQEPHSIFGGVIFAIFGSIFGLIGISIAVYSLKSLTKKTKSVSKSPKSKGSVIAILFFGAFALAGFGVLIGVVIPMWKNYYSAKDWVPTNATVIWSTVRSHKGDDGSTYSVDIFYKYSVNGHTYKSNGYGLMGGSSSGRANKEAVVKEHPKGKSITCYVNPANPHQTLLKRELGWWAAFTLFPLPFIAIGAGGLGFALFGKSKSTKSSNSALRNVRAVQGKEPKIAHFKPTLKRWLWLLGSIAIAAFWNGIVSLFLFGELIPSWQRGDKDWFLTLFLTPFVLVGIGFILNIFYRFLACFNPAPNLTLAPGALTLTESATLKWNTLNGEHRVQDFTLYLVGEEKTTYRRGKNSHTETSVFYEEELFKSSDPRKIRRGELSIELPQELHPSWDGDHNSINWQLKVRGDISFWPDISDDYAIEVLPNNSQP